MIYTSIKGYWALWEPGTAVCWKPSSLHWIQMAVAAVPNTSWQLGFSFVCRP